MTDRESLRTTLVGLLEDEMGQPYDLDDDAVDLRTGLGLDSVDVVGLVMRVERQFRIRLAMEELLEVKTVGDLLELVFAKKTVGRSLEMGSTSA
ncbi:acyl carrier protein [Paludisphaera borealis]|uniref:Acyl carrier protein n=1 Tax=Paludisphaera borealis TaxID=1387353 RepID=A0A1U7CZ60_9BACT|nr:acyl carrier protein [Paludisphaera borealis]APW64201.1 Acyl carrier protein [Paludisphaera borealis]